MNIDKNILHQEYDIKAILNYDKYKINLSVLDKNKMTYNFINHFHPYVEYFIEQLNTDSIEGLLDIETQKKKEEFFKGTYKFEENPLFYINYKDAVKNVDLSVEGAYSLYNWELFFHVPITIAVHLSKNQRFADAQKWFHFIFDPTNNDQNVETPERFWMFKYFRENTNLKNINEMMNILSQTEEDWADKDKEANRRLKEDIKKQINVWRNDPFKPHAIGRLRPLAYQLQVVMKYLDNLIAFGDSLFRQDTMETVNEATQLYVLAANILGSRPQEVPKKKNKKAKTFNDLKKEKLDPFGNAMVEIESNLINEYNVLQKKKNRIETAGVQSIGKTLYFCIPKNDQLLEYWDRVSDRLFKIRHCMNIEGRVRQLPLFQPPIDPGMLVKAAAAGIDLSSVISGLNQPVSNIRAPLLIQKALEICNDVKSLGNSLLSAIEKKEGETLSLLRQKQEIKILTLVQDVKYLQWKESQSAIKALIKSRESAFERYRHYQLQFGKKDEDLKEIKKFEVESVELNEENFDEIYQELVGKYKKEIKHEEYVPMKVMDGDLNLNQTENAELNSFMPSAHVLQEASSVYDILSTAYSLIPQFTTDGKPLGVGAGTGFGGVQLSKSASIEAQIIRLFASHENYKASRASKQASYQRRAEDWTLQSNLVAKELMSIGQQIISSLIREQISKKEYENHKQQIENTIEIETFMKEKFSNEQLYTWMQSEISKVYYESYKFAFDIAKKAEQTMKHELMRKEANERDFIKFNYWDAGRKGLLSGEGLYLDIKRMEMAYHEYNKREYELTKHISLQQLDPMALLKLKVEGSCEVTIPEWLFDMDCPGHYMRRIKTVSLSIPCVVGSYTSINCTLSLQKSTLRKSSLLTNNDIYVREDEDTRFIDNYGTIQSIVTSNAQNDSGVFELNLRDEQYLPFEGAGAESTWRLELPSEFRQFDYITISDVIIHMRYTAREGGGLLQSGEDGQGGAEGYMKELIKDATKSPLVIMFSLKHDFPNEWHRYENDKKDDKKFTATIKNEHYSYVAKGLEIGKVEEVKLVSVNLENLKDPKIESETLGKPKVALDKGIGKITISKDDIGEKENLFLVFGYPLSSPS